MLIDLASGLRTLLGRGSPLLGSFGLAPKGKRKVSSQETKTLAVAKYAATRKARGTRGKVQKLVITAIPGPKLQVLQPAVVVGSGSGATAPGGPREQQPVGQVGGRRTIRRRRRPRSQATDRPLRFFCGRFFQTTA